MSNQQTAQQLDAYTQSVQGIIDRNFEQDFADIRAELENAAQNMPPALRELSLQLMEASKATYKIAYTKGLVLGLRSADEINALYDSYGLPKNAKP